MDIHVYIYGRVKHEFELEMTARWNELIMFCYYFTFLLFSKNIGLKMNELVEQLLSINLEKITHKTRSSIVLVAISNNHSSFDYIIIWSTARDQLDDVVQN